VLVPRAQVARDALPQALRAAGHHVTVVAAYVTQPTEASTLQPLCADLRAGNVDALVISSSSTITHLVTALGVDAVPLLARTRVISIGPITTQTAQQLGIAVAATATVYSVEGLVDAITLCLA